ncbi:Os03g0569401 [Oryza sativa Japonica Group]|uniref:Os03g0569401 protein n=1 Tax=Oryza sativa subsp. japonica TaxID=39947 RepID=A0A0P0W0A4_ORYSJ|nr:Os03g0569401 [Oryza sativa Japonica Group]
MRSAEWEQLKSGLIHPSSRPPIPRGEAGGVRAGTARSAAWERGTMDDEINGASPPKRHRRRLIYIIHGHGQR